MNNIRRCGAVWYYLLSITILLSSTPRAYAHPSSQKGILLATYVSGADYNGYYIGGDDVGWSIDENYHSSGTMITYSLWPGIVLHIVLIPILVIALRRARIIRD